MKELIQKINLLEKKCLIGISGFGGSGKTTLAKKLSLQFDMEITHVDDFALFNSNNNSEFSYWNMMDFERLETKVLKPFKNNLSISYRKFDWDNNILGETFEVESNSSLIVEGVGLLRPDLIKYFDFSIWVDCDIEESIYRGMKRAKAIDVDNDILWNGLWKENDLQCYEIYKPKETVNYIYDNKDRKS